MKKFTVPMNAADVCRNALAREQELESLEMVTHSDISAALLGYRLAISYVNDQIDEKRAIDTIPNTMGLKEKLKAIREEYGQFFDEGGIALIKRYHNQS